MGPAGTSTCPQCGNPKPAGAWEGICPTCVARLSFGLGESAAASTQCVQEANAAESSEANPAQDFQPASSSLRFGDYQLLEEIGRGGMGIVYRARQLSLNRIVAVKMIPFGSLATDESVRRFRAEAESAAALQHPNVIAIHEVGEQDGQHYFSMDYVKGCTLADLLSDGPLPSRRAASLLGTIARAVHYAHQRDILHRDLKPSNILIDECGEPRITDFGLARRLT